MEVIHLWHVNFAKEQQSQVSLNWRQFYKRIDRAIARKDRKIKYIYLFISVL